MKRITKIGVTQLAEQREKTRVAAYCRVSTDSDEQLIYLEAQKSHYESYIRSNDDWEYAGLYYDEGITGTKKELHSGLLTMMADCEDGEIDMVITKSISRFARNITDCLEMVRKLTDLGITIIFEKENINTSTMESELMLSILASLAESESISISKNSKWSIRKRFEKGTFIISYPPYGYANVDGEMIVVPEQAEIVKEIFAVCLEGQGTHAIARVLNERNVTTKKGGNWTPTTINGMLVNEKYTTDSNFCRHTNYGEQDMFLCENHHEAIISHEDFNKVREVLDRRALEKGNGSNTSRYQNRYALSGKIRCGHCGGTFKRRQHYKPSGNYIAWTCGTHLENKDLCPMLYIEDESVKAAFMTMVNKLVFGHQQIIKPLMRSLRGMDDTERLQKISDVEQKIEEITDRKQSLISFMAQGLLDADMFFEESQVVDAEEQKLLLQKEQLFNDLGNNKWRIKELQVLENFTSKSKMLTEFDDELFLAIVEKITVHNREQITFCLKAGLNFKERLVM